MIKFNAIIARFEQKGEKTGWTYVTVPAAVACLIKPGVKKSFRVRGLLDQHKISGVALLPMGEGDFILTLKSSLKKVLEKKEGDPLYLELEEDIDFEILMPPDLELCLSEEQKLMDSFLIQPKSHQNYFINWLNAAKTEPTRVKRLTLIVMAMEKRLNYGEMIRAASAQERL